MNLQAVILEMQHVLKGDYPLNVPLAEGIDLTALTEGDDKPMFLTLPIATETTSRNGVKYQRKDVERIVSAINNREIIGQKGHLTEAERSHRFDTPSLFWVGATLDESGMAWGKAYIPRTAQDVREYVRVAKAMNSKIGTSIYGLAEINDAMEIVGDSLTLEQIDLVNPSRVGVTQATGVPIITQETIQSDTVNESTEEKSMDPKTQPKPQDETQGEISETESTLRAKVNELTSKVRALTTKNDEAEDRLADLNKVVEMLGNPSDVVLALQAELAKTADLSKENLRLLQSAITAEVAKKVAAESVRPTIESLVNAQKPTRYSDMLVVLENVLAQEHIKLLLKHTTLVEMGPPQQRPVVPNNDEELFFFVPDDK